MVPPLRATLIPYPSLRTALPFLCLLATGFLPVLSGCASEAGGTTAPSQRSEPRAAQLQLVEAKAVNFRRTWRVRGVLEPSRTGRVAFIIGGRLQEVSVGRGDLVEEGQVLARLETAEVNAGIAQARGAVAAAEANVKLARDALTRLESLSRSEAIANSQVVKVRLQLEAAQAMRAQAGGALRMASVKAGQHVLRAPLAGTVLVAPETLGEIVGPGIPQFEIASLDRLRAKVSLPAEAAGMIRVAQEVTIHPREGETLAGRISTILPALTADTHRQPVEVEVVPPAGRPGLANSYVEIEVGATESTLAVSIPATAIVREEDTAVFVLAEGGLARRVVLSVLSNEGDQLIVSGLAPGAQVIDFPRTDLTDGSRVQR